MVKRLEADRVDEYAEVVSRVAYRRLPGNVLEGHTCVRIEPCSDVVGCPGSKMLANLVRSSVASKARRKIS